MATVVLVRNVLKVVTRDEEEFLRDYEQVYAEALASPHEVIVLDFADAQGLGEDAFRLIALTHVSSASTRRGKRLRARVPPALAKAFKHAGLYKQMEVTIARETPLLEAPELHSSAVLAALPDEEEQTVPTAEEPAAQGRPPREDDQTPPPLPAPESPDRPPARQRRRAAAAERDADEWVPPEFRAAVGATDRSPLPAAAPAEASPAAAAREAADDAGAPASAAARGAGADTQFITALVRSGAEEAASDADGFAWVPGDDEAPAPRVPSSEFGVASLPLPDPPTRHPELATRNGLAARNQEPGTRNAAAGAESVAAAAAATVAMLVSLDEGPSVPLDREEIIVGRLEDCDLVIPTPYVSKRHARFVRRDDRYFVEDLDSANGTFVDGAVLTAPVALAAGMEVTIARTKKFPEGVRRFRVA